jgi:hypothetical protein
MKKLRIMWALWRYLREPHPMGVKYTINRANGQTWFLVEPAHILVPVEPQSIVVTACDPSMYVRVGGGEYKGEYVYIGSPETITHSVNVDCDNREPNTR